MAESSGLRTWSRRAGEWGTYIFAAFALAGTLPASAGLIILTVAFLLNFRDWRVLSRDPLIQVCLVFAGYVTIHSVFLYVTAPQTELAEAILDAGPDWVKLLLFVPFAYWAGGRSRRIGRLLFLALLGFTVGFARKIDWASFDATFFYTRFEAYLPAIAFGMFAGLAVLGLIALRESFWVAGTNRIPGWARISVWLLLLAIMLEALFLSFSRTTWIAFTVAAVLLMYLEWRARRHNTAQRQPTRTMPRLVSALVVAIALAGLLFAQWDRITERMLFEQDTAAKVLRGEWSEVESDSIGLRVHALRFAAYLTSERPWLGWGAGSSSYLIDHSQWAELSVDSRNRLGHLHNAYAEILVQFGIAGLALASAIVALLVLETAGECRGGKVPGPLCRFLLATLIFILIWNLTSYRIVRHDGLFFWVIFAGIAYSFRLRTLRQTEPTLMSLASIPLYWRRKLKILLHNLRCRDPAFAMRVTRAGDLFHLSVGGERIAIVSISRWSKYRRGIPFQLEKLARRYGTLALRDRLRGRTVIDIGANIGELSLYCQRAGARVYAIEPDPVNYAALVDNTAGTGIEAYRVALWDKEESLTFYSAVAGADSSLIAPDAHSRALQVDALPLDKLTEEKGIGRVFLIKADAEGAEPEVLRGARETLRRTCCVAIDCGPERRGERTFDTCRSILSELGFETRALDEEANVLFGTNPAWEIE